MPKRSRRNFTNEGSDTRSFLDWLGQVYPDPEGHDRYGYQLALDNLKQIWPNFRVAGAEKVVVAGTLLDQDQRTRPQDALGGMTLAVALVTGSQEVLEARIRSRNSGRLLEDFLARTAEVARDIEASGIYDFKVHNDGATPREIARDLLGRLAWI